MKVDNKQEIQKYNSHNTQSRNVSWFYQITLAYIIACVSIIITVSIGAAILSNVNMKIAVLSVGLFGLFLNTLMYIIMRKKLLH